MPISTTEKVIIGFIALLGFVAFACFLIAALLACGIIGQAAP